MNRTTVFSIAGSIIGAVVNILINLISSWIQAKAFNDQFSEQSIWWLVGFALIGLILGYVLSILISKPDNKESQTYIEVGKISGKTGVNVLNNTSYGSTTLRASDITSSEGEVNLASQSASDPSSGPKAPPPA